MQLQQVATTWTHRTNTLLVVKLVSLDINDIIVTKIWLEWTTFLLVNSPWSSHASCCFKLDIAKDDKFIDL
jgi:hypothetical protein